MFEVHQDAGNFSRTNRAKRHGGSRQTMRPEREKWIKIIYKHTKKSEERSSNV